MNTCCQSSGNPGSPVLLLVPISLQRTYISRFGVIPKSHQPDKWRLIVDLSHPTGKSVNDGIPKSLCSMSYITTDHAISTILALGRGTLLAKIDVKSAFRLIPVNPSDRHLLAMKWRDNIYVDTCLPFGLRSAPKLFNIMADLLAWILEQQGVSTLMHYLDDFLTMGHPHTPECQHNLDILIHTSVQSTEYPPSHPKGRRPHPLPRLPGHYVRYNPHGGSPTRRQAH